MSVMLRSQTPCLGGYNNPTIPYWLENKSFDGLYYNFKIQPGPVGDLGLESGLV